MFQTPKHEEAGTSSKRRNRQMMKQLIGKSVLEAILTLPKFTWTFREGVRPLKTEIKDLVFVDYQKQKPRQREDLYQHINTSQLSLETLRRYNLINGGEGQRIGLISKVALGRPFTYEFGFVGETFAHIPMLDFDLDSRLDQKSYLPTIKRNIKAHTELAGLLLCSGRRNNYHFIGIGNLLNDREFVTMCGLGLGMFHRIASGEAVTLVDPRWISQCLTPMYYMGELNGWSQYDFVDRFATLRITPKEDGDRPPTVIDVVE